MQKKKRFCHQLGHDNEKVSYICTFKQCDADTRWVCSDCLLQQTHNHEQKKLYHIIKCLAFQNYINIYQQKVKDQNSQELHQIQLYVNELNELVNNLQQFIIQLQDEMNKIEDYYKQLLKITHNELLQLNDEELNKILQSEFVRNPSDTRISQGLLIQVGKACKLIMALMNNNDESQQILKDYQQQNTNHLLKKYENKYIFDKICKHTICSSQISNDLKFLAIGGYDKNSNYFTLNMKYDTEIIICKFTNDSKFLYCGDSQGQLHCFEMQGQKTPTQKFVHKIHSGWIFDIIILDNNQILSCSGDLSIKITNTQNGQELLSIENAHTKVINGVDYDQVNNAIISCSNGLSIKLFNRQNGKLIIENKKAHQDQINQIQFITHQKLISSSYYHLILWQIDQSQKQLSKLNVIDDHFFNFTAFQDSKRIVVIQEKSVLILEENFNVFMKVDHDIIKLDCKFNQYIGYTRSRQLIDYIIVTGQSKFLFNCLVDVQIIQSSQNHSRS